MSNSGILLDRIEKDETSRPRVLFLRSMSDSANVRRCARQHR